MQNGQEIIQVFSGTDLMRIQCFYVLQECKEVVAYFSHQLLDSLQKATRLSLDALKKRIFVTRYEYEMLILLD